MSSLKDRLKRLTGGGGGKSPEVPASGENAEHSEVGENDPGIDSAKAQPAEDQPDRPGEEALSPGSYTVETLDEAWTKLDAHLVKSAAGSFIRRRRTYPVEYRHGSYVLGELRTGAAGLAALTGGAEADCGELLFFDTETTGLGLGAGNVPFMIGLGYWEEEGFAIEQLFIRNPAEELAMLDYLNGMLASHPYLISYNGRSFDWPLLKNRFVLNRMKDVPEPVQVDFLYPSRSLWRNTLPSCRLGKVEEARLGFFRQDDVPGSMAPTLYFLYLAEKRPSDIAPVFVHNEWDILSLAGLAILFGDALDGRYPKEPVSAEETFRLGLWLHRTGREELSLRVLEGLEQQDAEGAYLLPLAAHYKQLGRYDQAVRLWLRSVELRRAAVPEEGKPEEAAETRRSSADPLEPYVELSMYYEHRVKDCAEALRFAREAYGLEQQRQSRLESLRQRERRLSGSGPARRWEGYTPKSDAEQAEEQLRDGLEPPLSDAAEELLKRILRLRRKLSRADLTGSRRAAAAKAAPPAGSAEGASAGRGARRPKKSKDPGGPEAMTLF